MKALANAEGQPPRLSVLSGGPMKRLTLTKETLVPLDGPSTQAIQGGDIMTKGGPCLTAQARTQCACQIPTYQIGCATTDWAK